MVARDDTHLPRAPEPGEHPALLAWLDDGLRGGRRGRLAAEYPTALDPPRCADHRVIHHAGRPVAHAMLHESEVHAAGRRLRLGLIGAVYTAPEARRRGLASACVEACVEELERRRVPLVALWSDRHDFYARLGFHPAGRERRLAIDPDCIARARRGESGTWQVDSAQAGDLDDLEALYAAKPVRTDRARGDLARLVAAPDTRLVVARRAGRPRAYAALGRGDDFGGVVHEWAGDGSAVLSCLQRLCTERGALGWLCGPIDEPPFGALRAAGARVIPGCFALLRVIDAQRLWDALLPDRPARLESLDDGTRLVSGDVRHSLRPPDLLDLFFGAGPEKLSLGNALADRLPWPLYVWGFDSV